MMVHQDKRGGSLIVDRKFTGVGRIKRASGTSDPVVFRKINRDLTRLYEDGRLDILRSLRDKRLGFLEVRDAIQRRALDKLPTGRGAASLDEAWLAWTDSLVVPRDCSKKHKESLETSRRYLAAHAPKALVADLPRAVAELRDDLGKKYPRSFNMLKSAAQAFLRETVGRAHPLWIAVAAVEPRKYRKTVKRRGLELDEMREHFPAPESDPVDAIAWTMATTGMHAEELWGEWSTKPDRIHVEGTKRRGRVRDIPLVRRPSVPRIHRRTFENGVRERGKRSIQVYDLRRTYSHWMEEAGIPRTRRRLYMGHGVKDVTDLYENAEVTRFLAEDAERMCRFLGLSETMSHDSTHEGDRSHGLHIA